VQPSKSWPSRVARAIIYLLTRALNRGQLLSRFAEECGLGHRLTPEVSGESAPELPRTLADRIGLRDATVVGPLVFCSGRAREGVHTPNGRLQDRKDS